MESAPAPFHFSFTLSKLKKPQFSLPHTGESAPHRWYSPRRPRSRLRLPCIPACQKLLKPFLRNAGVFCGKSKLALFHLVRSRCYRHNAEVKKPLSVDYSQQPLSSVMIRPEVESCLFIIIAQKRVCVDHQLITNSFSLTINFSTLLQSTIRLNTRVITSWSSPSPAQT